MLRVVLVGYGELVSSLMLGVIESRHELAGILSWENSKSSNFLKNIFWPDPITSLIKSYKINEIEAESVNSPAFIRQALKLEPDVILVGSWGEKLQKKIIMLPKIACINCHPSLLPAHRGSNPYASVILNGETKSGITFHLMDDNFDTGPILLQKEVLISSEDTGGSLRTKCAYSARTAVKELLDGLENARYLPKKQNEQQASYFPRLRDKDAKINWNNPARVIHNQIRALNPWIDCYTKYRDYYLLTNQSRIIELKNPVNESGKILYRNSTSLVVSTGDPLLAIRIDNVRVYGFMGILWSRYYIEKYIRVREYLR